MDDDREQRELQERVMRYRVMEREVRFTDRALVARVLRAAS
jgi:hypothetical protein